MVAHAPEEIQDADSDRLAGALLEIQGAQRTPQFDPLSDKDEGRQRVADSRRVFEAERRLLPLHRCFGPYFAVAAEEMAYAGKVEEALDLLSIR